MVSYLKLVVCLFFFTTSFTLMGIASTVDAGRGPWPGTIGGGLVGLFVRLVFGGALTRGKLLDVICPPGDNADGANDDSGF